MPNIDGMLLTFDLAASTGYAWGHPDETPQFATHVFPSTGDNLGKHQENARDFLAAILTRIKPVAVGFEQPSLFAKSTPSTVRKLTSYCNTLEELCRPRQFNIPIVRELNPSTMKKFWTDNGKAKKEQMVERSWKYGFRVSNDDEADAIAGWYLMVECFGTAGQKQVFRDMRFAAGMGDPAPVKF